MKPSIIIESALRSLAVISLLSGCGYMEYSPWQSNAPDSDLNMKALARAIENSDGNTDDAQEFKFVVLGDTQIRFEAFADTVKVVEQEHSDVDFIAIAGDVTDLGLRKEFEWLVRIVKDSSIPIIAIPGNHDGLANGKKLFRETFGPLDWSFDYKGQKFIHWNNNGYEWNVDVAWLDRELDESKKSIVIAHQPPFAKSLSDEDEEFWQKLRDERPISASIHAHTHHWGKLREASGVPLYTVADVRGQHFVVVTVSKDGVASFEKCSPACVREDL